MSDNTRPLGHLLKLLNISYASLGGFLHIDRTVVNKWATGKRSLKPSSQHYDKVIKYMIDKNTAIGNQTLETLFSKLYTDIPYGEEYLSTCINRFLSSSHISFSQYNLISNRTDSGNILVFGNIEGRYRGLMELFDKALSLEKKQEIILLDPRMFAWLLAERSYFDDFLEKMKAVLEKGHKVTVIYEMYYFELCTRLAIITQNLVSYSNYHEHCVDLQIYTDMLGSEYLLKDHMVIYGSDLGNGNLYTIVLNDPLSLAAAYRQVEIILGKSRQYVIIGNDLQRFELFRMQKQVEKADELSYIYTPDLCFLTMSRTLLDEVLRKNDISGELYQLLLDVYDTHSSSINKNMPGLPIIRHLCCYDQIKEMLDSDEYCMEELSVITGRKIIVTRELAIRHLKDTIAVLRRCDNYNIGFLRSHRSSYEDGFSCRVVKNHYFSICKKIMRFIEDIRFVNNIVDSFEDEWEHNIPTEYKNNQHVAERLEGLLISGL